jgi:hypothetical protein
MGVRHHRRTTSARKPRRSQTRSGGRSSHRSSTTCSGEVAQSPRSRASTTATTQTLATLRARAAKLLCECYYRDPIAQWNPVLRFCVDCTMHRTHLQHAARIPGPTHHLSWPRVSFRCCCCCDGCCVVFSRRHRNAPTTAGTLRAQSFHLGVGGQRLTRRTCARSPLHSRIACTRHARGCLPNLVRYNLRISSPRCIISVCVFSLCVLVRKAVMCVSVCVCVCVCVW